jgi:hypothetical protein
LLFIDSNSDLNLGVEDVFEYEYFINGFKATIDIGEMWNIPTVICN